MPSTINKQEQKGLFALSKEEVRRRLLDYKIVSPLGHWLCNLKKIHNGHTQVTINNAVYSISRVSAYAFLDLDWSNPNQQANHKIECGESLCFNPDHLYVGTQEENMQDCVRAGNNTERSKTQCSEGHPYNEENTKFRSNGKRVCKICSKVWDKRKYEKRKKNAIYA